MLTHQENDLINSKLGNSLTAIVHNATDYHLHLSDTILRKAWNVKAPMLDVKLVKAISFFHYKMRHLNGYQIHVNRSDVGPFFDCVYLLKMGSKYEAH